MSWWKGLSRASGAAPRWWRSGLLCGLLVACGCTQTPAADGPQPAPGSTTGDHAGGGATAIAGVEPISHQPARPAKPRQCPQKRDEVRGSIPRGCDRAFIIADRIVLLTELRFEPDKAILTEDSQPAVRDLAALLEDHPEIEIISIEAHLGQHTSRHASRSLSRRRARRIRTALTRLGISSSRLRATGFGADKPIADAKTPKGRAKNRRIELRIVSRGSVERIPLP